MSEKKSDKKKFIVSVTAKMTFDVLLEIDEGPEAAEEYAAEIVESLEVDSMEFIDCEIEAITAHEVDEDFSVVYPRAILDPEQWKHRPADC